ncbi:MAG: 3-oxoadipate enol-lactonase [Alphaproteobacteria bacterium]|nr:3-oxoadipate enol-lactonase [Alphaproteobacteria bacterium]
MTLDTADIGGCCIAYRFDGPADAPVVMLSNSLSSNLSMWDDQIAALTAHYGVLRYDQRGHGQSAVTPGPYSFDLLADDVRGLLRHLGIDSVQFVGLSMGGMTGQSLGVRHPDILKSLVLCDTSAHMPPAALWDERIALARNGGMEATSEATLGRWFTAPFHAARPDAIDRVRQMIETTPVEGYAGCCIAIRDMNQTAALSRIAVPTRVIVGAEDPSTPVSASQLIHGEIAGSELVILDDAAHLSNIEKADEFNAALLDFLLRH